MTIYALLQKIKYSKIYVVAFVLLLMIFGIGCKKSADDKISHINSFSLELNGAHKWLEEIKIALDKQGKANIEQIEANIDSSSIQKVKFNQSENLVIIPLRANYKTRNITVNKTIKILVLFQDLNNKINGGEIVEIIPNKGDFQTSLQNIIPKIYKRQLTSLDGIVSFMTISNNLFSEYNYKEGSISSIRILYSKPKKSGPLRQDNNRTNEVICTDWYWQTYEDGILVSEIFLYTTCDDVPCPLARVIGKEGSSGLKVACDMGGGGGGGGGQAFLNVINNRLNNPCLKDTWNKIFNNGGFQDDITNLLNNTFGASNVFNVTIQESTTLPDNKSGTTNVTTSTNGLIDITVNLNINVLPEATKEFTAITIYHEVIHAYLSTTGKFTQIQQHNEIANSYLSCMTSALMRNFPSLGYDKANALAWGGLETTSAWSALSQIEKDAINVENTYQHAGVHGTLCN